MNEQLQKIHDQARRKDVPIMLDGGMEFLLAYIREHENIMYLLQLFIHPTDYTQISSNPERKH